MAFYVWNSGGVDGAILLLLCSEEWKGGKKTKSKKAPLYILLGILMFLCSVEKTMEKWARAEGGKSPMGLQQPCPMEQYAPD